MIGPFLLNYTFLKSSGILTLWISWISMDIMDIHGHYWICMDMDMVDIQMDIQNGYPCWISKMDIHVGYPCHLWISNMDIHFGYVWMWIWWISKWISRTNTYSYRISMSIIDIQHGYHVWISIISMISRGHI